MKEAILKYHKSAPKLSAWMDANVAESFTVFALPPTHHRRLRTSNLMERISKEIKRRTRVATLFPNEASLLRLVSAILDLESIPRKRPIQTRRSGASGKVWCV